MAAHVANLAEGSGIAVPAKVDRPRVSPAELLDALEETLDTRRIARRRLPYIREVLGAMDEHLGEIDAALRRALENWRLDRLSAMDRAVLRIGATELLFVEGIPPKVAIQEAIRLAEAYGGDESPGFVNGVLDALYKRAAVDG